MPSYTIKQLCDDGPQYAMAMLLNCLANGEPFLTYKDIKHELEYQLGIKEIFPIQIGHVAGTLMDKILEIDPKAPLLNALITRPNGVPGNGVGEYFADRYENPRYRNWKSVSFKKKKDLVEEERTKIFSYRKWKKTNTKLFGAKPRRKLRAYTGSEFDFEPPSHFGGNAESDEHKKLKKWVAKHPKKIGLRKSYGIGEVESRLLSGDKIDVLFTDRLSFCTVEVKSIRSNNADFERGIYQCVKYREVKKAEHAPYDIEVHAILVTERELPGDIKERAKELNIKCKTVSVNK